MLRNLSWKCSRLFAGRLRLFKSHSNSQLIPIRSITGNNLFLSQMKYPLITSNKYPIFGITHSFRVKWSSDLPSHNKIVLPALSPTMEVGTIKEWKLKEGEKLEEGEVLAEIETDKAVMDFACPDHIAEGYLAKIIAPEGVRDIKIGSYICIMVQNKEDVEPFIDYVLADTGDTDSPAPVQQAPPSGSQDPIQQQQQQQQQPPAATGPQVVETGARLKASPYARKLASEMGVDLSSLRGSGPGGRIVANDVTQAGPARKRVYTGPRTDVPLPTYTEIEMSSVRRTIAKRLQASKQNIPHYYLQIEVGMDEIARLRNEFNAISPDLPSLSVNDFIIKAAAAALRSVPECNTSYHEEFCIRQHHNVDVCVAVATEGGLLTPIIFTADKKGLREINRDVTELAEKARLGNLQPQEFIGGTFTLSNLGMYGVSSFSAIINPPQSCILAIGATREVIVPDEKGCYKTAKMMSVQLSCDHRVVDGAVGAKWLKEFKRVMECPAAMLL